MPVPALRAKVAAQARHYDRAVPGTGTMATGPGRAFQCRASAGPAGLAHLENYTLGCCLQGDGTCSPERA